MDFVIENKVLEKYNGESEVVVIPDTVETINRFAFYNCDHIKKVIVPDSVVEISPGAFQNCKNLTNITLSKNLTKIESFTFCGCVSLKSIKINKNIKSISQNAFKNCEKLEGIAVDEQNKYFKSLDGVLFDYDITKIICYPANRITRKYEVPETVTKICSEAFENAMHIIHLTLPKNLLEIEYYAFYRCESLQEIFIPKNTKIGPTNFTLCESLQNIEVDTENKLYKSKNGVLFNSKMTSLICYPAGKPQEYYEVPKTVRKIYSNAFLFAENLKGVSIPKNVELIAYEAFFGCRNLEKVDIAEGVSQIGALAFSKCSSLKEMTLPNSISRITWKTFYNCPNLEAIKIPNSVRIIGEEAFGMCPKLNIYCEKDSYAQLYAEEFFKDYLLIEKK